jgi:CRP-like cAMP-binding protein
VKNTDPKIGLLRTVPGFAALSDRALARLASCFDEAQVGAGSVLAREGGLGHELLLIVEGQAAVSRAGASDGELGPGELVGETAVLGPLPHSSRVVARTPMRVLVAGPESLRTLSGDPSLLRRAATSLAARLRAADVSSPPVVAGVA